jgi:hypothetical protein
MDDSQEGSCRQLVSSSLPIKAIRVCFSISWGLLGNNCEKISVWRKTLYKLVSGNLSKITNQLIGRVINTA